jgi:tight adherence protein C
MDMVSPDLVLVVMAAMTVGGIIVAASMVLAPPRPLARRAQRILDPAAAKRAGRNNAATATADAPTLSALIKRLARRFEGLREHAGGEAATRLSRAGWRSKDAVVLFVCARIAMPFLCGGVALLLVNVLNVIPLSDQMQRLAPVIGVLIGFVLPGYYVGRAIGKREQLIQRALPNGLDLLVICAEAGLSLDFALQRVASELEGSDAAIADEFAVAALERRLLPERRKALDNLAKRCQIPAVRALVQTLLQAEEYGTPLSQSLRVLSSELRAERMLKAESKAAKTPVVMTVPLVLFIMPALFIVLIGPGLLQTIDSLAGM